MSAEQSMGAILRQGGPISMLCLTLFTPGVFVPKPCFAQQLQQPGQSERAIADMANRERIARGLGPLAWDQALANAAGMHALAMIQANTLSHQLPNEPDVAHRAAKQGAHFSAIAENIAYGPSAATIEQQWMQSPPHRANILDPRMNLIGIRLMQSGSILWAVEDFAAASPALSPGAVEQAVERELRARGLHIAAENSEEKAAARAACPQGEGGAGAQARFVVRWESADLHALPQPLADRISSEQYSGAAVGACPASSARNQAFSAYRVAVLLF